MNLTPVETLNETPRQAWQLRRDLVIAVAAKAGASREVLADVFDLDVSRIKQILRETRRRYAHEPASQPGSGQPDHPRRFVVEPDKWAA